MVGHYRGFARGKSRTLIGLLALTLLLPGCLPQAPVPLTTVVFPAVAAQRADTLIVLLPGRRNNGATFDTEGFVAALRDSGLAADIVAAEAHFGYYARQTLATRLHQDVVLPARAAGYRAIWLVGISMGGLGALWYDMDHPGFATGIVALSPYLGDPPIINEIAQAGGLLAWQSPPRADDHYQRVIWRRLKRFADPSVSLGRVFVGYGLQDDFASADGLFAAVLPAGQVQTIDGGHDWPTWRALWNHFLPRLRPAP